MNFPWRVHRTGLPFFLTFHSFSHDASTNNYTTDHCFLCYLLSICGHTEHVKLSLFKRKLKAARSEQRFVIAIFLSTAISSFAVNENFPRCYYFLTFMQPINGLGSMCPLNMVRSRVQNFAAWHTKAAPNGKCCEGYIVPSMVRLMYQLKSVLK